MILTSDVKCFCFGQLPHEALGSLWAQLLASIGGAVALGTQWAEARMAVW